MGALGRASATLLGRRRGGGPGAHLVALARAAVADALVLLEAARHHRARRCEVLFRVRPVGGAEGRLHLRAAASAARWERATRRERQRPPGSAGAERSCTSGSRGGTSRGRGHAKAGVGPARGVGSAARLDLLGGGRNRGDGEEDENLRVEHRLRAAARGGVARGARRSAQKLRTGSARERATRIVPASVKRRPPHARRAMIEGLRCCWRRGEGRWGGRGI